MSAFNPVTPSYVQTPGGRLHCREAGTGRQAILFFHETPLSSKTFVPSLQLLGKHMRGIAFDTPGYGESALLESEPSIEAYGDALWGAIQQMGLDEVAVCGIHTGASIAVELASRRGPGPRIVGAVLSGVPVLDEAGLRYLKTFAERDSRPGEETILQPWRDRAQRWFKASDELLVQALADELAVFSRRNDGFKAVANHDIRRAIENVEVPVLVLNGAKDSMAKIDAAAAPLFRNATLELLPDWGGQLQWTAAEVYVQHLLKFLLPHFSV